MKLTARLSLLAFASTLALPVQAQTYTFSTLAGSVGAAGSVDGTGSAARFNNPSCVAVDSSGIVYVADFYNHTIRKISNGVVTTLAGTAGSVGSTDGTGSAARFHNPFEIALDNAGILYVSDALNHTVRKVTSSGVVTTLAGSAGNAGSTDGSGSAARFNFPAGLTVDGSGNVFVADNNNSTIRKMTSGGVVTTLAGTAGSSGSADGIGGGARFKNPYGVAVDSAGNVYVGDTSNHTIRKISSAGVVTTLAGMAGITGSADGTGSAARFFNPTGLVVDSLGNLFVPDTDNRTIRKIASGGVVTTLAGMAGTPGSADGTGGAARFSSPQGMALDSAGNLYVADASNQTVRKGTLVVVSALTPAVATTTASSVTQTGVSTGGNVTSDGGATVTQRGVVYGTSTGPTTGKATFITSGTGTGSYTVSLAGLLTQGTTYYVRAFAINSVGTSYGNEVSFSTLSAPAITTQPASQTSATGGSATFTVVATGNPAVTYQWRKDGADVSGATSATLSLSNVQSGSAGTFTVVVTNSAGTATSSAATLTVTPLATGPTITTQPASVAVAQGTASSFSVVAAGTAPFTYQWRKDGVALSGAMSATLAFSSVQSANAGDYTVVVTNSAGSATSVAATLTVNVPPSILTQPLAQSVTAGANVSLTVTASGTSPLTYQWRKDGAAIAGATNSVFSVGNVQTGDAGSFSVVVTNSVGSVNSNAAALTVTSVPVPPAFTAQPQGQNVTAGSSVALTVTMGGTSPFTYQWRKDGTALAGATGATLTLTNVQSANAGDYTVVVTNSAGSATSAAATLTVNLPPSILTQPQAQSVTAGANVSFSVTLSGTPPFSYQWRKDGTALSGATNSTFALGNVQSGDTGAYSVVVVNSAGSVNSSGAGLTVNSVPVAPTITTQPQGQNVSAGSGVAFTVAANGSTPFTYQWRKDGSVLAGATNVAFTLSNVQAADAGIYTVVVGNSAGSTTSNLAVLTITAVNTAPAISQQPSSQSVPAGGAVTFAVTATGTAPLTYQWRKGSASVAGATGATLTINNAQSDDAGNYSVVVSNSAGALNSAAAVLTVTVVGVVPTIAAQPSSQTVGIGANVTFSVAASGSSPFTYQWRLNGAAISGATSDTLILGLVPVTSAGNYTVVVTNNFGSATSNPATLSVIQAPTITTQLVDQSVTVGANVVFTVVAAGAPPLTYQWTKDGRAIAGASNAILALTAVTDADAGSYRVVVTNGAGTVPSRVATLVVSPALSKIVNLSVRTTAGTGSETLIAGFVIAGQGPAKPILLRGIGPSLAGFGVTGVLVDPAMELYRGTIKVAENDNWGDSLDVEQIGRAMTGAGAFPIPERGRDAALFVRLQPASYSAQVSARAGVGIALIELYDTEIANAPTRLINVSARSSVGTGAGVLIAGFVISGNTPKTVLVRGIGPTLTTFGVAGALSDPQLVLNRGNEVVALNDEWWRDGGLQALPPVFAATGAFTLVNGTHDAAIVAVLSPGTYTATVSGVGNTTGVALIEVYEVP